MRPLVSACVALGLALAVGACGGDDDNEDRGAAASAPAAPASAGEAYTEQPYDGDAAPPAADRGTVVGRSGFDLKTDAFAFANYGPSTGPMMRAQEIRELFGDEVCVDATKDPCTLTPAAEQWRTATNKSFQGGHCYGFSTLSLKLRRREIAPSQYGAETTWALRIADAKGNVTNPELHADLTRSAANYLLGSVLRRSRRYTAKQTVEKLRQAFASDEPDYVLSVFPPKPGGGHAVVPIALEDQGGGIYDLVLYDNNYPYFAANPAISDRRMRIDTNKDRWDYTVALRPGQPQGDWFGVGFDNPIELVSSADQQLPQPCPFCGDAPRATRTMVTLESDPARHGHLRITDAEGRVTGWNGTSFVNEIPGSRVRQLPVIQRDLVAPEPIYALPSGRAFTVEQVDAPEGAPAGAVHVTGPGIGASLTQLVAGTALTVGADGAAGLRWDPASGDAPELTFVAPGDRALTAVPAGASLRVTPVGDDVRVAGELESGTASNPANGREAPLPSGGGRIDLDEVVGG